MVSKSDWVLLIVNETLKIWKHLLENNSETRNNEKEEREASIFFPPGLLVGIVILIFSDYSKSILLMHHYEAQSMSEPFTIKKFSLDIIIFKLEPLTVSVARGCYTFLFTFPLPIGKILVVDG